MNLHTRTLCNRQALKWMYEVHELPREVVMASGRKLTYIYDSLGGLEQVMLPRGGRHSFWQQEQVHSRKVCHLLPGSTDPYCTFRDLDATSCSSVRLATTGSWCRGTTWMEDQR